MIYRSHSVSFCIIHNMLKMREKSCGIFVYLFLLNIMINAFQFVYASPQDQHLRDRSMHSSKVSRSNNPSSQISMGSSQSGISTNDVPPAKTTDIPCQIIYAGTLCDDDVDYPLEAARNLSRNDEFRLMYGSYFVSNEHTLKRKKKSPVVAALDASVDEGTPLCTTHENLKTHTPTKLLDKMNKWHHILQDGANNLHQVIQIEVCENVNGPCVFTPAGHRSTCEQKYTYRKLVWVMNDHSHGVDEFRIPSCCSCRYFGEIEKLKSAVSNTSVSSN